MPPHRQYRVPKKQLEIGAKHEMEHTTSERTARRIARVHLQEHPSYYQVLPVAEKMMSEREKKIKPIHKKRREPDGLFFNPAMRDFNF